MVARPLFQEAAVCAPVGDTIRHLPTLDLNSWRELDNVTVAMAMPTVARKAESTINDDGHSLREREHRRWERDRDRGAAFRRGVQAQVDATTKRIAPVDFPGAQFQSSEPQPAHSQDGMQHAVN